MTYRVGLERGAEGGHIAWILDYPGCFVFAHTEREVLERIPEAIRDYFAWLGAHGIPAAGPGVPEDFRVVEIFEVYTINERFERGGSREVNAWFLDDWRPLTEEEVEFGLQVLAASRADLQAAVEGLPDPVLDAVLPGQRWSMRGVLRHVAYEENGYLSRLGRDLKAPPAEIWAHLEQVRYALEQALQDWIGQSIVVGVDGEFWSPRKVLRRAAWHERDHVLHLHQLRRAMGWS
ncbi:type II toxin-antitoxin system HicB family antitoxin [Thermoflexus sp.]|uniref:type II toxin-antitoxin system HicB family antitoxin n=1 Tax=Thermoflexus sp. TaxID=1969742 RepID=UPI0035E45C0F